MFRLRDGEKGRNQQKPAESDITPESNIENQIGVFVFITRER